ncbi:MAG: cache domain-containing protein, partial [Lachnospiraceae bacterium]|nr:cache domain-containing protein [Lachnospiraceae bacterium]
MKKTGRVYKRMIITYVLVLCIPILLSAVLYQFTYRTVREQSLEYNHNLLNNVSNSCDRDISYYRNVLMQLKLDEDVKNFLFSRVITQNDKLTLAADIMENMSTIRVSMLDFSAYCHDIFVYSYEEDDVLSSLGKANYENYSKIMMAMEPEDASMLRETMIALEKRTIIRVKTKTREYILLLEPVENTNRSRRAVVGLWIAPELFNEHIGYADENINIEWAFVDKEGKFLYQTNDLRESAM